MSGKKLRGRRLGRHKLLIYKQRVVYFSCTYSEPISSTIKPSFRVRQQYPPVCWTHAEQLHPGARACTETQSINQRRVGGGPGSFSTPADRSASQKLSTRVRLCPRLCCSPSRRRGRRPPPSQWPVGCRADAEGTRPARSYPGPPWGFSTPRSSDAPLRTASA